MVYNVYNVYIGCYFYTSVDLHTFFRKFVVKLYSVKAHPDSVHANLYKTLLQSSLLNFALVENTDDILHGL